MRWGTFSEVSLAWFNALPVQLRVRTRDRFLDREGLDR